MRRRLRIKLCARCDELRAHSPVRRDEPDGYVQSYCRGCMAEITSKRYRGRPSDRPKRKTAYEPRRAS